MPKPTQPILLYGFPLSGHSHRAELMLRLLELPYEVRQVNLPAGEQKGEAFLRLNPFGAVPVIDDNGTVVADSAAILVYLAQRYDEGRRWLPADPVGAAEVQRWLSVAQGPIANGPAVMRVAKIFGAPIDLVRPRQLADRVLAQIEAHLTARRYLLGDSPTIADVALYSYIAVAPEGELSLEPYKAIGAWLKRIEALPNFIPMPQAKQPAGETARQ
jgi:glutathione S-transferase